MTKQLKTGTIRIGKCFDVEVLQMLQDDGKWLCLHNDDGELDAAEIRGFRHAQHNLKLNK